MSDTNVLIVYMADDDSEYQSSLSPVPNLVFMTVGKIKEFEDCMTYLKKDIFKTQREVERETKQLETLQICRHSQPPQSPDGN